MEKKPPRQQRHSFTTATRPPAAAVWDCDSALYDSFELRSFEKHLSYAIINSSRTLSMPHLPDRRVAPAPTPTSSSNTAPHHPAKKNTTQHHKNDYAVSEAANNNNNHTKQQRERSSATTSSRISKSVQRFFKSVFVNVRPTSSSSSNHNQKKNSTKQSGGAYLRAAIARDRENGRYFVYDKTGALCTIPEGPESDFGLSSPDISALVKRSASERFTAATAIGISCA